jgi:D-alanine-D-alanine ligase
MRERCSEIINEFGGVLVEKYIEGREFTVLLIGSRDSIRVFPPAEYQFVDNKTFITFDDKWGTSYTKSHWRLLNGEHNEDEQKLIDDLISSAKRLYQAIDGDGCVRIDIRQDKQTKQVFILDFNSNVSLFYKDSCSADFIAESSGWSKSQFMKFLLDDALERQRQYHLAHSYTVKYSPTCGYGIYASRNLQEGDLVYTHENCSLKLITKSYAQQTFNEDEMVALKNYGK